MVILCGNIMKFFWRSLVKKYGFHFDEEIIDQVYNEFLDFYESKVELFDGTLEALTECPICQIKLW